MSDQKRKHAPDDRNLNATLNSQNETKVQAMSDLEEFVRSSFSQSEGAFTVIETKKAHEISPTRITKTLHQSIQSLAGSELGPELKIKNHLLESLKQHRKKSLHSSKVIKREALEKNPNLFKITEEKDFEE